MAGWLLGYPCSYYVTENYSGSNCLSDVTVVTVSCAITKTSCPDLVNVDDGEAVLYSFSIPTHLLHAVPFDSFRSRISTWLDYNRTKSIWLTDVCV